jgi:hypothetical protein
MSLPGLEEMVGGKEGKAGLCTKCDTYWLLIIVDWADRAQDQEIRIDGLKVSSNVSEKIIIYKRGI